jgi:ribosomal protein L5
MAPTQMENYVHKLCSIKEHANYNKKLHYITAIPTLNKCTKSIINCVIVSFNFKSISFNKKKILPFFLAIKLLTKQKGVASLSSRNVQAWKIRKGMLVGCKATLRNNKLYNFINNRAVAVSNIEKYKPYITFIQEYSKVEKKISFNLNLKELMYFSSIELTLGNHPSLKSIRVAFVFSTFSKEEQLFIIRYNKIIIN